MKINLKTIMGGSSPMLYSPVYRYGFLILILALLLNWILWLWRLSPSYPYERYGNGIIVGGLLFNHLAFAFNWRPSIGFFVRLIACVWLLFAFFYILYLSKILFPAFVV